MRRHAGPLLLGLALIVLLCLLRVVDPPILAETRLRVFDTYQRWSPRPYQSVPVRVVAIDEDSLQRLGQWPWPRQQLAELIENLGQLGAAAIALDMVFAEPDRLSPTHLAPLWGVDLWPEGTIPDFDQILADTLARYPVIGGFAPRHKKQPRQPLLKTGWAMIGPKPLLPSYAGAVTNLPILEAAFKGNGSFGLDRDQVIRRLPLLQAIDGQPVPTLAVEALRVAQGADTIVIRSAQREGQRLGLERIRIGALEVPVTATGELWLHYTEAVPERLLSAWRVLSKEAGKDTELLALIKGHIVLLGTSAIGLGDFAITPLNPTEPGVLIHAQAIEQMIQGWFLERPYWADGLEAVLLLILGLILALTMPFIGAVWCAVLGLVAICACFAGSWLAFEQHRLLLDPVFLSIASLLIYLFMSLITHIRSERERAWVRQAFSHYLAPDLVDQLVRDPTSLNLGGEARELSFLFSDLAGFTPLTEVTPPKILVRVLNDYLDGACQVVIEHGGTIDKIVGDALHVIFNAPLDQPDHARRAVKCAMALDQFAQGFAATQQAQGIDFGITRIGVNSGPAVVGNFGGKNRFDYTAYGDAINTTARLETANKQLGTRICIAKATVERCPDIEFRALGALSLKGKSVKVETYEPINV